MKPSFAFLACLLLIATSCFAQTETPVTLRWKLGPSAEFSVTKGRWVTYAISSALEEKGIATMSESKFMSLVPITKP